MTPMAMMQGALTSRNSYRPAPGSLMRVRLNPPRLPDASGSCHLEHSRLDEPRQSLASLRTIPNRSTAGQRRTEGRRGGSTVTTQSLAWGRLRLESTNLRVPAVPMACPPSRARAPSSCWARPARDHSVPAWSFRPARTHDVSSGRATSSDPPSESSLSGRR